MSGLESMIAITPVILCGGSGTRLWPLSRSGFPKQFLSLDGDDTLFQLSAKRATAIACEHMSVSAPLLVTNEEHRFVAIEQLREIGMHASHAILEPVGKNTAPAVTFAALAAQADGTDPVLVIMPADQTISDQDAFVSSVRRAIEQASSGGIVILGIRPTRAETGYGYINVSEGAGTIEGLRSVEAFVEKPDAKMAEHYVATGNYYWNAGIFVLRASVWLKAINQFRPDILTATEHAWTECTTDGAFVRPLKSAFEAIPSESVDYAVLEKCVDAGMDLTMAPLDAGWSDLGIWDAVWSALPKDAAGNAQHGDVIAHEVTNTLVHATSRLVAVVGVDDLVIVETPDAVLVTRKRQSQGIKHVVDTLARENRDEHTLHRKVHRPWGWYDSFDDGHRFKVKRILVKPGASLSLQKHHHRAEHWVVVSGTAEVTCGDSVKMLTEDQSTYIPVGEIHRLKNPGVIPLEIIEIQSGSYLGEDDIVRLDDVYGRAARPS